MTDQKHDDETTTAFTMQRIRNEVLEEAALVAENWITEFGTFSTTGEAIAAAIRALKT